MNNALDNLVADIDRLVSEMGSNLPLDETSRSWYAVISAQFLSFNRRLRDAIKEERTSRQEMEKPIEASNMKSMREALELMNDLFDKGVICTSYVNTAEEMEQIDELYSKAKAAISAPPRACDVMSQEDLTKVSTNGFMKALETHPEFNADGIKTLVAAAISAAIKCAYDTQLVSKMEGAIDESK